MLKLDGVEIGYKNDSLVKDINIECERSELVFLTAANGKGKSTLLHTICGTIEAMRGEIHIGGKKINSMTLSEKAKKIIYLPSKQYVHGFINVRQYVSLGRFPYSGAFGQLSEMDTDFIVNYTSRMGIEHLLEKDYNQLSDGEQQRVNICRALVQNTDIILLDEPTAFLDYSSRLDVMQLLSLLSKEDNKLLIVSSHNLELALDHADKFWLINQNREVVVKENRDLRLKDLTVEMFS